MAILVGRPIRWPEVSIGTRGESACASPEGLTHRQGEASADSATLQQRERRETFFDARRDSLQRAPAECRGISSRPLLLGPGRTADIEPAPTFRVAGPKARCGDVLERESVGSSGARAFLSTRWRQLAQDWERSRCQSFLPKRQPSGYSAGTCSPNASPRAWYHSLPSVSSGRATSCPPSAILRPRCRSVALRCARRWGRSPC